MKRICFLFLAALFFKAHGQCPPHINASMLTQTLTCYNPTILAAGSSTTPNTVISWMVPANPPVVNSNTIIIGPPNGPVTSTTSTSYAVYTVVATNTAAACQSTSLIVINQNFKPPIASPSISIATPTAVYCTASISPVVLTIGNSTTTSGGGPTSFISNPCWQGPSPQTSTCGILTYSCYVPGIYSLTVMDNYNGCVNVGTVNVIDRTQPPVITNPYSEMSFPCNSPGTFTFGIAITGTNSGGLRYFFSSYPPGSFFTPSSVIMSNINPILSGSQASLIVIGSQFGTYNYIVTNTLSGCQASGVLKVKPSDAISGHSVSPMAISCSTCCNGTMGISFNPPFTQYSMTVSQGSLNGIPPTSVSNICIGWMKYCLTNTVSACKLCDSIYFDMNTSLPKFMMKEEYSFNVYPNPAHSSFFIDAIGNRVLTIRIMNADGSIVESFLSEGTREIEVKGLASGIYFVEVNDSGKVIRRKVIVLR